MNGQKDFTKQLRDEIKNIEYWLRQMKNEIKKEDNERNKFNMLANSNNALYSSHCRISRLLNNYKPAFNDFSRRNEKAS